MPTIYVTAPREDATAIARELVERRLAACVNTVDCDSTYRWDGEIHHDEEAILLAKTTADRAEALVEAVGQLHPYEVPCIERFDETEVAEPFERWRADAVTGAE